MFYKSLGFDSQIDLISFPASPCEPGAASAMPVVHKPLYNASYVLHFWRDRMDEPPYQGTAFGTRSFVNGFWHLAGVTRYFLNSHSAGRFKSGQCTETRRARSCTRCDRHANCFGTSFARPLS
jgi:hypothetical protein